jgi:hypothetical protein
LQPSGENYLKYNKEAGRGRLWDFFSFSKSNKNKVGLVLFPHFNF